MKKKILALALSLIMCAACFGCTKPNKEEPTTTNSPSNVKKIAYLNETGGVAPIALYSSDDRVAMAPSFSAQYLEGNSAFAIKMLNAMGENWTGVFSPISIQVALEVLANGGDETSSQLLLDALCPGMTREDVNLNAARLIATVMKSKGVSMNTAVVVNNALRLSQNFAKSAADYYSASVGALDFSDPAAAVREINEWISKNTSGLIKDMIEDLSADTVIVILNALTLSLEWETKFYALRELIEFKGTKSVSSVGAIASSGNFAYGSFDKGEAVILPYAGGEFAMALILPTEGTSPSDAVSAIMGRLGECSESSVIVRMPKIDLNTKLDILSMAGNLGLAEALAGNYPNIASGESPVITQVSQSNALLVNENGTVAASASAVVGTKGSPILVGEHEIVCNRPYAMLIYHVESGMILYVSVINNL